jgi:hypothetical protein
MKNKLSTNMSFPYAPCTQKQRKLIQELCVDLEQVYPDFTDMNRDKAHKLIQELLNLKHESLG